MKAKSTKSVGRHRYVLQIIESETHGKLAKFRQISEIHVALQSIHIFEFTSTCLLHA